MSDKASQSSSTVRLDEGYEPTKRFGGYTPVAASDSLPKAPAGGSAATPAKSKK